MSVAVLWSVEDSRASAVLFDRVHTMVRIDNVKDPVGEARNRAREGDPSGVLAFYSAYTGRNRFVWVSA